MASHGLEADCVRERQPLVGESGKPSGNGMTDQVGRHGEPFVNGIGEQGLTRLARGSRASKVKQMTVELGENRESADVSPAGPPV